MSDLWKATPTSPVNIPGSFTSQEFAAALKHLKPRKASCPDSICPELITHAEAALKSCMCCFLSSFLRHLKIPKIWRRALVEVIPKTKKPVEDPKRYCPISLLYDPYKILEGLIYARVEPIVDPLLSRSRLGYDGEREPWIRLFCLLKTLRIRLRSRKRLGPCLSI